MEEETKVVEEQVTTEENTVVEPETNANEELAKMRVEMAKLKKALDKSSSETASYKKQLREKQTADEIALQEKAEADAKREEEYQALLKENQVNKFAKSFLELGYSTELAEQAANAQYENDTATLFAIQKNFMDNMAKELKANLLTNQPVPPITNSGEVSITQEQFDKMSLAERSELFKTNKSLYEKLAN